MIFGRSRENPLIKKLRKMQSDIEKGKTLKLPETRSRQDIIKDLFRTQLSALDMEPSSESGFMPSSQTPLAKYLRRFGVADDIIDAILAGLAEEESAQAIKDIIDAAADTPQVNLHGEYLTRAKELALEEWKKRRALES